MKFLSAIMLLTSFSAMASISNGTLKGTCTLVTENAKRELSFEVGANRKAVTKFNDDLIVSVINNLTNKDALYFSALEIGIERKNDSIVRNPPILCPSRPLEVMQKCETENARNVSRRTEAPWEKFLLVENDGISAEISKVIISAEELKNSLKFSLPQTEINGTTVECVSTFYTR